jgi:hypothetical protein
MCVYGHAQHAKQGLGWISLNLEIQLTAELLSLTLLDCLLMFPSIGKWQPNKSFQETFP